MPGQRSGFHKAAEKAITLEQVWEFKPPEPRFTCFIEEIY
jgi:hypothetical protein